MACPGEGQSVSEERAKMRAVRITCRASNGGVIPVPARFTRFCFVVLPAVLLLSCTRESFNTSEESSAVPKAIPRKVLRLLEPFAPPNRELTEEVLKTTILSGVSYGGFGQGTCVFVATPTADGGYDVRVENKGSYGSDFESAQVHIDPGQAQRIRKALFQTAVWKLPIYRSLEVIDAGCFLVFLDLQDGTTFEFGGTDGTDRDGTPLGTAMTAVYHHFVSRPMQIAEWTSDWLHSQPSGELSYTAVYDIAPLCSREKDAQDIVVEICQTIASDRWGHDHLNYSADAMHDCFIAHAPPGIHSEIQAFLAYRGLPCDLNPISVLNAKYIRIPVNYDLEASKASHFFPPPLLTSHSAKILPGALLFSALSPSAVLNRRVMDAIRNRQNPFLVLEGLTILAREADEQERYHVVKVLRDIAMKWKKALPQTSDFLLLPSNRLSNFETLQE